MADTARLPYLDRSLPQAWKALNALALQVSAAAEAAGLERETVELMNVRVSQLNGCAFCLDLHTRQATEAGVTVQKLSQVRGEALGAARSLLGDETFAAVEWAAVTMNAFNRVSILSEHPVRVR